ncbi:MAG: CPBP family intramembrane glutamic endopeptidase [Planctomycetaceae bacterium]
MASNPAAKSPASASKPAHGPEYWVRAREPLACLIFLAPLLVVYEVGILMFGGPDAGGIRNGADYWMREWLMQFGFEDMWLLPGLVVGILLIWHVAGKYSWRVSADTLVGMFAESLLFAFLLVVVGQFQGLAFERLGAGVPLSTGLRALTAPVITYTGAGLYEEVLFRLCLLPVCYLILRTARVSPRTSAVVAILATSLLFSAAHYVGNEAYEFTLFSFTFRALAGLFFAVLFVVRGFGITVGCHAAYDVLVGVLLTTSG